MNNIQAASHLQEVLDKHGITSMDVILDQLVDGYILVDSDGIVIFCSKSYENIHRVRNAEGKHIEEVMSSHAPAYCGQKRA